MAASSCGFARVLTRLSSWAKLPTLEQMLHLHAHSNMLSQTCASCCTNPTEEYCDLHRCVIPSCHDKREASQYCASHVPCTKYGCQNFQCIYDESYRTRPLCVTHWYTCRDAFCPNPELSPTLKYCKQHKCYLNGCEERIADERGRIHCPRHGCRTVTTGYWATAYPRCGGSGADANAGRSYCTSCTCIVPSCCAQRYTSTSCASQACKSHRCRSAGCDDAREDQSMYCIEHIV